MKGSMSRIALIGLLVAIGLIAVVGWYGYSYLRLGGSVNPFTQTTTVPLGTQESPSAAASAADEAMAEQPEPTLERVASGLEVPWSIAFTSESRMLVTERPGRIRVIENGQLRAEPLITLSEVSSSDEEGLMGMVLHPEYAQNKEFYVCYAYPAGDGLADKVVQLRDNGQSAEVLGTVLDNIPAARFHAGCELGFGPDGTLYVTTGDATDAELAQELDSLAGKILRLNPDGSIPEDNPRPGSYVYSYGHRNPQGIAWHPETGELFATEHGPSGFDGPLGGDEINAITANGNYGWPEVSHQRTAPEFISPLLVYTPAVAPGSAVFYTGSQFPAWQNSLFFAALKGEAVYRLKFDTKMAQRTADADSQLPDRILEQEKVPLPDVGRIREITQGPDGYLYITTSNRDGRGTVRDGDDKIWRIVGK